MPTLNATTARKNFFKIMDEVAQTHRPITITGQKRQSVVILSEQDWKDIEETIYLTSIPNMTESIIKGMKEPLSEGQEWKPKKRGKSSCLNRR